MLLDLRLPTCRASTCVELRAASIVPIIIITAQTDTYDLVAGLEAGADDYHQASLVPKELAADPRPAAPGPARAQPLPPGPPRRRRAARERGIVLKAGAR